MTEFVQNWLTGQGLNEQTVQWASWAFFAIGLTLLAVIFNYVVKKIVLTIVHLIVRKSRTVWDDVLADRKVFSRISHLAPALVFYFAAGLLEPLAPVVEKLAVIYMLIVGLSV